MGRGGRPVHRLFVASSIASDASLRFVYPAHAGSTPAMSRSPPARGSRRRPKPSSPSCCPTADIRKLPVRPSVYAELLAGHHDPFRAAAAYDYGLAAALIIHASANPRSWMPMALAATARLLVRQSRWQGAGEPGLHGA